MRTPIATRGLKSVRHRQFGESASPLGSQNPDAHNTPFPSTLPAPPRFIILQRLGH